MRRPDLGDQLTASPEPWLAHHLGVLAPTASLALREEYARRAAAAAAYREAAGITDPHQAVSLLPHRSNPELENLRLAAVRALEIRDEAAIARGSARGELEARAVEAERAQASAPPDVSRQLRRIAQAEADAWRQHADAATRHDHTQAAHARTLSGQLAAERQRLEAVGARLLSVRPTLSAILARAVIAWEYSFPLVLVAPPSVVAPILLMGVTFHAVNAYLMGLNTFFWSFAATYPAILYCSHHRPW